MQHARARRALLAAVVVALSGLVAIPLKGGGGPAALRVAGSVPRSVAGPSWSELMGIAEPDPAAAAPLDEVAVADGEVAAAVEDARPEEVPAAPLSAVDAGPGARVKAVVIGVDEYPSGNDLRSAVNDADDMAAALARWGVPAQNVALLENGAATVPGIVGALRWLVANTGPDDTAVVSFAGHARTLGSGAQAIVASDGRLLTDRYLANLLAPLPARHAWIVMEACYGGGFDELLAPGRILTAAADASSLAYENESFGRSYLGQYVVREGLLEGQAGGPTIQQAVAWAQAYLHRDAPSRQITSIDDAAGPISLDGVDRSTVPPPAPLPAETGPGSDPPPPTASSPPPSSHPAPPSGGSPAPPSSAPPEEPPCRNVVKVLCPRP